MLCTGLALLLAAPVSADAGEPTRENRIKAALVFKIAKFIEWPPGSIRDRTLTICTHGDSPVATALAGVDGREVRGFRARYRRLEALDDDAARGSQVLYLSRVPGGAPRSQVPAVGHATLTVGDAERFAARGGMVGLVSGENRVTFEINLRAARAVGIDIAAPLLELANVLE